MLQTVTGMTLATTSILLLSSLTGLAQNSFTPVQWSPQVFSLAQCGMASTTDLSGAVETVAQLLQSTTSPSSLPGSCMEIKESSPNSPSGYYTISNSSGGSVVVYCNMDDLYSCPALEQTLKGMSSTLNSLSSQSGEALLGSCKEIKSMWPDSVSDYYMISDANGHLRQVYCNMEELCGLATGWMRVAYLNMSDPLYECPPGLQTITVDNIRSCGRQETSASGGSCHSVFFPTYTLPYSHICGRVYGYQEGGVNALLAANSLTLEDPYVDGVSLTYSSPRKHIWTFAAALQENSLLGASHGCPCTSGSSQVVPSYIGNDYYCESGSSGSFSYGTVYVNDYLWDGQQCGTIELSCCQSPNLPWFNKVLSTATSDPIELRVCGNEATSNEDNPVAFYDIYVR